MAGEPYRKAGNAGPRPLGAGRDLRAVTRTRAVTTEAAAPENRARGERRGVARIQIERAGGLQQAIDEPASDQSFFLPRQTGGMTLFLVAAYAVAAVVFQGLPSLTTLSLALASAALFACGSLFARIERRAEALSSLRFAIVFVAIIVPMTCAGISLAMWVGEGLPWQWAIATLVCINAASAALFDMRIISLFCAKIAIWTGFAVLVPEAVTYAAVFAAALTSNGRQPCAAATPAKRASGSRRVRRISCAASRRRGRAGSGKPTAAG